MCNAHNHPPGCTCGWGQGPHNGGYGLGGWSGVSRQLASSVRLAAYGEKVTPTASSLANTDMASPGASIPLRDSKHALRGSWVNPNAQCPVCGSPVYFYCSADGGRVYFDELGPPWPKHPCTDRSAASPRLVVSNAKRWDQDGWQPLVDFQVTPMGPDSLYRIVGNAGPYERRLLFRLDGQFEVEMVRFNEAKGVSVALSLLARDCTSGEWLICEGPAKIAPNFPPMQRLSVVERIPDATVRVEETVTPDSCSQADSIDDVGTVLVTQQPLHEPTSEAVAVPVGVLIEEIDNRLRALLAEIEALNAEKSRLLLNVLKPSGDSSR